MRQIHTEADFEQICGASEPRAVSARVAVSLQPHINNLVSTEGILGRLLQGALRR